MAIHGFPTRSMAWPRTSQKALNLGAKPDEWDFQTHEALAGSFLSLPGISTRLPVTLQWG